MGFQIKDFASITASILNHARATTKKITDWIPGSVARTLVEAPAVEVEELYLQFFNGLRSAIPVATFRSFNFGKLPPAYARGFVSISRETPQPSDLPILAGTLFTTVDGRRYLSTEEVLWAEGETSVRVPIIAADVGLAHNAAQGVINASPSFNSTYTVSNSAIDTGRDAESDGEREARFAEFVAALSQGTVAACTYAAKQASVRDELGNITEYVTRVGINENPGFVRFYVYSSAGVPSDELLASGQRLMDGWRDENTGEVTPGARSGGVRVDVLAMSERAVAFSAAALMLSGYTLSEAVIENMRNVYASRLAGVASGDTLYMGSIETALLSVVGVKSVVPDAIENITCGVSEALVPGAFNISAL